MIKKFIIKFLLVLGYCLAICATANVVIDDYYGNGNYSLKYQYLNENQSSFNNVIFGSSRFYRQRDPQIIYSLLSDYQIFSFNLSIGAISNPEQYNIYEKWLNNLKDHNFREAFMELHPLINIADKNEGTKRNYYYLNLTEFFFSLEYIFRSQYDSEKKKELLIKCLKAFKHRQINIFSDLLNSFFENPVSYWLLLGKDNNGYCSLDLVLSVKKGKNYYSELHFNFLQSGIPKLEQRTKIAQSAFEYDNYDKFYNPVYHQKIIDLIEKSKAKGINLIFIIPPGRTKNQYTELLAIKNKMVSANLVEFGNPSKYPSLLDPDYRFDIGHLNEKGSRIFSKLVANRMKNLLKASETKFD